MPRNRPTAPTAIGLRSRMPATSRSGPTSRSPGIGTCSTSATVSGDGRGEGRTAAPRSHSAANARRGNPVTRTRSTRSSRGPEAVGESGDGGHAGGEGGHGPILRSARARPASLAPPVGRERSPMTPCGATSATATMAAVSTRRIRGPRPTGSKPAALGRRHLGAARIHPPGRPAARVGAGSGPRPARRAADGRARRLPQREAAAPGGPAAASAAASATGASTTGTSARPHWRAASRAIFSQRGAPARPRAAPPSARSTTGTMRATPSSVVFWTRKSIRSPRGTADQQQMAAAGGAGRPRRRRRRARARSPRARPAHDLGLDLAAAPSKSVSGVARPRPQHAREVAVLVAGHGRAGGAAAAARRARRAGAALMPRRRDAGAAPPTRPRRGAPRARTRRRRRRASPPRRRPGEQAREDHRRRPARRRAGNVGRQRHQHVGLDVGEHHVAAGAGTSSSAPDPRLDGRDRLSARFSSRRWPPPPDRCRPPARAPPARAAPPRSTGSRSRTRDRGSAAPGALGDLLGQRDHQPRRRVPAGAERAPRIEVDHPIARRRRGCVPARPDRGTSAPRASPGSTASRRRATRPRAPRGGAPRRDRRRRPRPAGARRPPRPRASTSPSVSGAHCATITARPPPPGGSSRRRGSPRRR